MRQEEAPLSHDLGSVILATALRPRATTDENPPGGERKTGFIQDPPCEEI
jgi:hypothetical protein